MSDDPAAVPADAAPAHVPAVVEPSAPAVAEAPAGAPSMFFDTLRGGGMADLVKRDVPANPTPAPQDDGN